MIAKGHIDAGENCEQAAIREASEELGLKKNNIIGNPFLVWKKEISGLVESYDFAVFAVNVKDTTDFDKPDYETKAVHWMTLEQFIASGRTSHHEIVIGVAQEIRLHLKF